MRTPVLLLAALLAVPGCTHRWEERHTGGTVLGAATGTALGALIGSAAGSWGKGAAIGAGAGALTGYLIAESTRERGRPPVRYYEPERRTVVYRDPPPSEADQRRADADAWFEKGLWAANESDAEYYFKRSLDLYPTPPAYNNLGLLYLRRGDREQARLMWTKALELDSRYEPAQQNLDRLQY